jgi:hypothetical protein
LCKQLFAGFSGAAALKLEHYKNELMMSDIYSMCIYRKHACRALVEAALDRKSDYSRCCALFADMLQTSHFREVIWASCGYAGSQAIVADGQGLMLMLQRVRDLVKKGLYEPVCSIRAQRIETVLEALLKNELGDTSLEGFNARQKLDEIEAMHGKNAVRVTAERKWQRGDGGGEADASGVDMPDIKRHGQEESEQVGRESGALQRCSNIKCRDMDAKRVHVPMNCKAGGQDWTEFRGKWLCVRCYRRFKLHGNLSMFAPAGKRERSEHESGDSKHKDASKNALMELAPGDLFRMTVEGLDGIIRISRIADDSKLLVLVR